MHGIEWESSARHRRDRSLAAVESGGRSNRRGSRIVNTQALPRPCDRASRDYIAGTRSVENHRRTRGVPRIRIAAEWT